MINYGKRALKVGAVATLSALAILYSKWGSDHISEKDYIKALETDVLSVADANANGFLENDEIKELLETSEFPHVVEAGHYRIFATDNNNGSPTESHVSYHVLGAGIHFGQEELERYLIAHGKELPERRE